jgi:UDP-N-acetylmuramoylalanine--D-glutamate ligase
MNLTGRRVTVLGMGISGQAAAGLAASHGAEVTCSDVRPLEKWPDELRRWCMEGGARIEAGGHDIDTCRASDLIVVSPGIPPWVPVLEAARRAGIPVVGELALAMSFWKGPALAITGTNGKTTTTRLVGEMLSKAGIPCKVGGNIGTPLSACIADTNKDTVAVLEVSSFQLDTIPDRDAGLLTSPRFKAAAWLNLAPDHLDRYHDLEAYGASKARILDLQDEGDWAVLRANDQALAPWLHRGKAERLFFGLATGDAPGAWLYPEEKKMVVVRPGAPEEEYDLKSWSLRGAHNLENLTAATLVSRIAGAPPEAVQAAINTFVAPPHRLQWVNQEEGVDYYDDSKATNVASVLTALESMDRPVVLIAGGRGKGEDYTPLAAAAEKNGVRAVIVIGEEATALNRVFEALVPVIRIDGNGSGESVMRQAVHAASSLAKDGDAVLLAPACASFDLFDSYAHRGAVFQEAVQRETGH